jgi:DNA polymerase III alpha subunit
VPELRQVTTRKGDRMAVLQLEDLTGSCEAVVFPKAYARLADHLMVDARLMLWASVDRRDDRLRRALHQDAQVSAVGRLGGCGRVEFAQVGAAAEQAAGAGQHDRDQRRVGERRGELLAQALPHAQGQRVDGRVVELDQAHVMVAGQVRGGGHGVLVRNQVDAKAESGANAPEWIVTSAMVPP